MYAFQEMWVMKQRLGERKNLEKQIFTNAPRTCHLFAKFGHNGKWQYQKYETIWWVPNHTNIHLAGLLPLDDNQNRRHIWKTLLPLLILEGIWHISFRSDTYEAQTEDYFELVMTLSSLLSLSFFNVLPIHLIFFLF